MIEHWRLLLAALPMTAVAACAGTAAAPYPSSAVSNPAGASVTVSGSAGAPETFALPSVGGYGGTIVLDPATTVGGISLALSAGASPPDGTPPAAGTALLFVDVTAAADLVLAALPSFTFTLPASESQSVRRSNASAAPLGLELYDPANAGAGYQPAAACTADGVAVTCVGTNVPFTFAARATYVFELTSLPDTSGATVIAVPSPAPILCSPAAAVAGVGQSVVVACAEAGYSGAFTWTVADPAIATVAQAATYTYFTVNGLQAGATTLALHSAAGGAGTLAISVTARSP